MRTHPVSRPCPRFIFLSEEKKRRLSLNHVKPSEAWFSGLVNLVLYCQTGFLKVSLYNWAHCIKDTAIRLASKWYPSNKQHLLSCYMYLIHAQSFLSTPKSSKWLKGSVCRVLIMRTVRCLSTLTKLWNGSISSKSKCEIQCTTNFALITHVYEHLKITILKETLKSVVMRNVPLLATCWFFSILHVIIVCIWKTKMLQIKIFITQTCF